MTDINERRGERVQTVAAGVRAGVSSKLGSIWWSFLLRGIFAIALGIFALFWPALSLSILVLAVGLYCVADGVAGLVGALRYPDLRENLVQALVVLGIGGGPGLLAGADPAHPSRTFGGGGFDRGYRSNPHCAPHASRRLGTARSLDDWDYRGNRRSGAGILAGQRRRGNLMGDRHRSDTDRRFIDLPGLAFQTPGGVSG